jgi:amino-acid N-acetyltransferase
VCLVEGAGLVDRAGKLIREVSPKGLEDLLFQRQDLELDVRRWAVAGARACLGGVRRAHLINRAQDGGLLTELYTRDGAGTLIALESFEGMRTADSRDLPGIVELIRPLEERAVLVPRSRERLEREIDHFVVVERDGVVVTCAALYSFADGNIGEVSCFAVHPEYRNGGQGERLLAFVEKRAAQAGMERLFVLTTHTEHWFHERGYEPSTPDELPEDRRSLYNPARGSKVLFKQLEPETKPW